MHIAEFIKRLQEAEGQSPNAHIYVAAKDENSVKKNIVTEVELYGTDVLIMRRA